jgi:hypothetical protein
MFRCDSNTWIWTPINTVQCEEDKVLVLGKLTANILQLLRIMTIDSTARWYSKTFLENQPR